MARPHDHLRDATVGEYEANATPIAANDERGISNDDG
jgi:hypothetical protein